MTDDDNHQTGPGAQAEMNARIDRMNHGAKLGWREWALILAAFVLIGLVVRSVLPW